MQSLAVVLAAAAVAAGSEKTPSVRRFEATYVGTIAPAPAETKRLEVWVPLPSDSPVQVIRDVKVEAPVPYTITKDSAGNSAAHFIVEDHAALQKEMVVRVHFRAERREVLGRTEAPGKSGVPSDVYLKENRLVPLTPRIRALAKQLAGDAKDPVEKARAFYKYLIENGTYDKTTPGWGRGDSERFCDVKKGNCTDFHSMFMALARAEGIPVRFLMGFPLKPEKEGTVPGYHCWAEFYSARLGWVPVDPSEASKTSDPARRAYLFGNLDPDRFEITTGRDLTLDPPQKDGPLNIFIYPYVEVDGKTFTETKIRLEYRDV